MRRLIMLVESPQKIEGLPAGMTIADPRIEKTLARGAHRATVKQRGKRSEFDSRDHYELELHPLGKATPYPMRRNDDRKRVSYYDPEMADLHTPEPDFEYARTYAKLKDHLTSEIEPLPDDNIIYRGMSSEEFDEFRRTGKIQSRGEYNMGGQEGLTYWTTDVGSACSYANSFAPTQHKATFLHPAYVVATTKPKETRRVKGTGEHEIGVTRPISKDEVVAVWRGRVYDYQTGSYDLRPDSYATDEQVLTLGGGVDPSGSVAWERLK